MKCKNKVVRVAGLRSNLGEKIIMENVLFAAMITNDARGKTLSLNDGKVQFTIPFEPIEKYFK